MDKSGNKIFENVQIFTYFERMINCQMRFIDIFTPDSTSDSNGTANSKHRGNFLSLEELKMSDETSKNVSYASPKQAMVSY